MKVVSVAINIKPIKIPVQHFETLDEVLAHVGNDASKIVSVLNMYGQQKDALVEGREYLSEQVVSHYKFPRKTVTVVVDGTPTEVDDDTDNDHVKRFIAAVANGAHNVENVHGKTVEARQTEISNALQSVLDKHGAFTINLNAAQRVGKPKEPADYSIKAAVSIIAANKQGEWVSRFTNGFGGVPPTSFEDFTVKAHKKATPEEVEAIHKQNVRRLAFAIMARERAKSDAAKAEYNA